jgi:phospholipid/cholesterol/gamma-HCH transport system substrate-binding protein
MTPAGSQLDPHDEEERQEEAELLAALPARSAHREVKVGIFVLLGIFAFLVALFTLTDVGTFRGRYYITTVVSNAKGLRNGDPAQMRGVNIGRVSSFSMVPEGVAIRMEIFNRYHVPEDSRVNISSAGLLGGMIVDVIPGVSDERAERDQALPGTVDNDMMSAVDDLSTQASEVMTRANALLSPQTTAALGASATQLQALMTELSALAVVQRRELPLLTQSLRRSAAGIEPATSGPAGRPRSCAGTLPGGRRPHGRDAGRPQGA